jgi:hypothetical protein
MAEAEDDATRGGEASEDQQGVEAPGAGGGDLVPSVDDLLGSDIKVDRRALMDGADLGEGNGETPLGVDALKGNLMSPRASPEPAAADADGAGGAEEPAATADGGDDEDAKAEAARKIQARQRGIADRKRVEAEKSEGNLPGQRRAVIVKPVYRESEKGVGDIVFYDGIGSKYSGELLNGRPHGKGTYTFANGNIYKGDFENGQFEGDGEMIYPGYGKFVSKFKNGRAQGGQFSFEDGLEYEPQGWPYCVEGDRRFYHEVVDPRFGLVD